LSQFLQFLFSGITVGATYALAALGFTLIYNASNVINFAQGEFIMLGGMLAFFFMQAGNTDAVGSGTGNRDSGCGGHAAREAGHRAGTRCRSGDADHHHHRCLAGHSRPGPDLAGQGCAQLSRILGQRADPEIGGATLLPQSLWVLGVTALVVVALWYFFSRTLAGKAILATSCNPLAAQLVGINTQWVLLVSFALSAALGAIGGVLLTPITLTSYDVGIMLGLKGFVAAVSAAWAVAWVPWSAGCWWESSRRWRPDTSLRRTRMPFPSCSSCSFSSSCRAAFSARK
jgi:branched-chain amino acid transport system permease protein